ncbi:MAG TPA: S8 family peptidase [Steroidobacteraceae bacterium]|nr:S8 family peptidase [Steroidobacteraceae bacterium]
MRSFAWLMLAAAAAVGAAVSGVEHNPVRTHPAATPLSAVQNIIVKLRATSSEDDVQASEQEEHERIMALAARAGIGLESSREIMSHLHVLHLQPGAQGASMAQTLARLRADPQVQYAEPDQRRYIHQVPDDPLYVGQSDDGTTAQQWYEQAPVPGTGTSATPSAVDAADAWSVTLGSNAIVIADIDTGVRFDHPDLLGAGTPADMPSTATAPTGRLLSGYCFITDAFVANGVACPGPDASDPGDWVTSADLKQSECTNAQTSTSSWHGTRVAGILGALTNNGAGIAGVTWNAWIEPLRALGVCGGQDSDIESAMLWAGGIQVPGYPANPYPAKIINMSLGGTGSCPMSYQDVISQLSSLGVLVVASAGNEGGPVDAPANCPGVIAVAGLRQAGTKVGFSNLGPEVAVGAPGGNCVNTAAGQPCLYSIVSATNLGTTTPAENAYTTDLINNPSLGTSFSAPIVSGIAGLMLAVNGNLTPSELTTLLEQTSTPFPQTSEGESPQPPMCHDPTGSSDDSQDVECICTNPNPDVFPPVPVTCGAGMANAAAAVTAAVQPVAAITVQPTGFTTGTPVTLNASGSGAACGYSIASYQWSSSASSAPVSSASGATTKVNAPSSGTVTVTLTLTDSGGHSSSATVIITPTSASTLAPASAGSNACLMPLTVVAVAPNGPSAQAGGAPVAFTASVGDNMDTAVTWQVNGTTGGGTLYGTISSSGLYTPPAVQPVSPHVMVSAVSAADPARSGWTQLTITPQGSSSSSSGSSGSSSSSSSGGGGSNDPPGKSGGGALDWITLLACALIVTSGAWRRSRAYS